MAGPQYRPRRLHLNWVRLPDLLPADATELLPDRVEVWDMQQGSFPDCHLIVAVAALAQRGNTLASLFESREIARHGAYVLRFHRAGEQVRVLIDDRIPCKRGTQQPMFARSRSGRGWPLLLEKAYAKFYGSYRAINGGNIAETMYDLSGAPVESINLRKPAIQEDPLAFYACLEASDRAGCAMTGGTPRTEAGQGHLRTSSGLVAGHAYGILGVCRVRDGGGEHRLVRLYNPWGRKGGSWWSGRWGIMSELWTPDTRAQVPSCGESEGIFYMCFHDFFREFDTVNICHVEVPALPRRSLFCGEFHSGNAGGCTQFVSWRHNDVYEVRLSAADRVHLVVANEEQRGKVRPGTISYNQVGFTVATAAGGVLSPATLVAGGCDTVFKTTFWNKREVYGFADLTADQSPCLFVVSTYYPAQLGTYRATFYSSDGTEVRQLQGGSSAWYEHELEMPGEWTCDSAAGLQQYWLNPQFLVEAESDCDVCLFLCQHSAGRREGFGDVPTSRPTPDRAALARRGRSRLVFHSGLRSNSAPSMPAARAARPGRSSSVDHRRQQLPGCTGQHAVALLVFESDGAVTQEGGAKRLHPPDWPPPCVDHTEVAVHLRLRQSVTYCVVPTTRVSGDAGSFMLTLRSTAPVSARSAAPNSARPHRSRPPLLSPPSEPTAALLPPRLDDRRRDHRRPGAHRPHRGR
eukprot:TRINITY_DN28479_c0_g1_i1.p1 TRINITY_DN28479_c0_g1~~TRINITY_DN28479_c0_g1_i1.p1  ORF type:complete len:789 (+),score=257.76 TRINITY_DN28479_c0_g1_i1:298-2367(+)